MAKETALNLTVRPSDYKGFIMDSFIKENPKFGVDNLAQMGVTFNKSLLEDTKYMNFVKKFIADAGLVNGEASITTPIQFAQLWMPDVINALYRGRTADKIFGSKNVGTWELEEIVWTQLTLTGRPNIYDDFSRANLASYNLNFVKRDTLRFEMGIEVTELEQKRAAQMRQNAHGLKKNAVDLGFDILLNHIKWFGFNDGARRLYGAIAAPSGEITTTNAAKAFSASTCDEMITALQSWIIGATKKLAGNYFPEETEATLVLPLSVYGYLTTANSYNLTPMKWMKENYPKVTIRSAPELDGAAADGDNIALFYVNTVDTIGDTLDLLDTSRLRLVGAVPTTKGFEESYSCSTAGAFHRCPLAFTLIEGV